MIKPLVLSVFCILSICPVSSIELDHPKVTEFANFMHDKHGFETSYILSILQNAEYQQSIIDAISSPAEFTWTWEKYRNLFIEPQRINNGKIFLKQYKTAFARAESQYGVPKEIIAAILGVETRYGKIMGKYKVIDALFTLGFYYPKREKFFRSELEAFILLVNENNLELDEMKGSYAGAMGFGQFISSSYRNFAVDFDNDGKADLLNTPEDAIGSVANYLMKNGWVRNLPVIWSIENDFMNKKEIGFNKVGNKLSLDLLRNYIPIKKDFMGKNFMLLEYELNEVQNYYVGSENFISITTYNRSHFYAKVVQELATILGYSDA
ncbi:MAG: lytic murein transglycosylase B [Gammaproteobacteria bacterium]